LRGACAIPFGDHQSAGGWQFGAEAWADYNLQRVAVAAMDHDGYWQQGYRLVAAVRVRADAGRSRRIQQGRRAPMPEQCSEPHAAHGRPIAV